MTELTKVELYKLRSLYNDLRYTTPEIQRQMEELIVEIDSELLNRYDVGVIK